LCTVRSTDGDDDAAAAAIICRLPSPDPGSDFQKNVAIRTETILNLFTEKKLAQEKDGTVEKEKEKERLEHSQ